MLGTLGLIAAYFIGPGFAAVAAPYVLLQMLYSGPLKHIVIIDVLTIAIRLRAARRGWRRRRARSDQPLAAGGTILLALFIGLAKRRHEIVLLAGARRATADSRRIQRIPARSDIGVATASTLSRTCSHD